MPKDASDGTLKFKDDNGNVIPCTLANIPGSNPERKHFIVLPHRECVYHIKRPALARISIRKKDFLKGYAPI